MKSSYIINRYGDLIKSLIRINQPRNVIEIGILEGFSTLLIANSLKKNKISSNFYAYDLFEDYKYNSSKYSVIESIIEKNKLQKFVKLKKANFYEIHKYHNKNSIDFIHIDISNTGSTVRYFFSKYDELLVEGAIVVFEGGSKLRDKVKWMKKYNMKEMHSEIISNRTIKKKYDVIVFDKYPSLSIFKKKNFKISLKNKKDFKIDSEKKFGYLSNKNFQSYLND